MPSDDKDKKLFNFDDEEVGIRSINLLKDVNISIPTSKWEITPRTATQSKRLKWDQTPFGVVKVESEKYLDKKIKTTSGFNEEQIKRDFMLNKTLTLDEINTILPNEGYLIYNIWNNEETEQIDFQLFNEEEKIFFAPLSQTSDEDLKLVYQTLYILKKTKRNKEKRVLKGLRKVNNWKLALEKIILFCFTFDLNSKEKELVLKLIRFILEQQKGIYTREVFYILSKFSDEEEEECKALFSLIFENGIEDFKFVLEKEIKESEKETRDLISKLLAIGVYHFGVKRFLVWFKEIMKFRKAKMIVLNSLIYIIKKIGNSLRIFSLEIFNIVEYCMKEDSHYIRDTCGYLIRLLLERGVLVISEELCKQIFSITQGQELSSVWIQTLSYFSEFESQKIYQIIEKCKTRDRKILKAICNLQKYFETDDLFIESFLIEENFKDLLFYFRNCKDSERLRSKLNESILHSDIGIELVSHLKNDFYLNEEFYDNLYIAVKNREIMKPSSLKWILRHSTKFDDLLVKDLNLNLIELVCFLDHKKIIHLGNIAFEKLENLNSEKLAKNLTLLRKIYRRTNFKSFDEIFYFCSMKLKKEEKNNKKSIIRFLLTVMKNNVEGARKFNRLEFIRICYEALDLIGMCGKKSRIGIIEFLVEISKFVNIQDVVDIVLDYFYREDNFEGYLEVLVSISNQFGFFYIFPRLLLDYKDTTFTNKSRIMKCVRGVIKTDRNLNERYIPKILSLVEDSILDKEVEMRKSGLKIVAVLVDNYASLSIDIAVVNHLLNLTWFCLLEKQFDDCWLAFIKTLGGEYLVKYLLQGLYHPSQIVKNRYNELFEMLKKQNLISENLIDFKDL